MVVALFGVCAGSAAAATPEQKMIGAINHARSDQAGLRPLRAAPELERSAGAFARYLVRHQQLAHRPSVSVAHSYPHCGEALAMHFSLAAQVGGTLRSWLASPVHRGLVHDEVDEPRRGRARTRAAEREAPHDLGAAGGAALSR